jgi:hypothetical protein
MRRALALAVLLASGVFLAGTAVMLAASDPAARRNGFGDAGWRSERSCQSNGATGRRFAVGGSTLRT